MLGQVVASAVRRPLGRADGGRARADINAARPRERRRERGRGDVRREGPPARETSDETTETRDGANTGHGRAVRLRLYAVRSTVR
jgi:hypothetical protein